MGGRGFTPIKSPKEDDVNDVMYPVNRWVEVKAQDAEAPRTIRLGVAQGDGRELFGVCMFDGPPVDRDRDVLSPSISHFMWDGFAEDILGRAQRRGWHYFHEVTPLKVSALELEVALYRLRLIHHLGAEAAVQEASDRLGAKLRERADPDQITVSAKDLEKVLDAYTSGVPAHEGDALYRLRRSVSQHRDGGR